MWQFRSGASLMPKAQYMTERDFWRSHWKIQVLRTVWEAHPCACWSLRQDNRGLTSTTTMTLRSIREFDRWWSHTGGEDKPDGRQWLYEMALGCESARHLCEMSQVPSFFKASIFLAVKWKYLYYLGHMNVVKIKWEKAYEVLILLSSSNMLPASLDGVNKEWKGFAPE
jgi:hypothetical protein